MRYRMIGVDPKTSRRLELVLDADDERAARAEAVSRGIVVEQVVAAGEPITVRLEPGQTLLVELTAKRWKALLLVSLALLALGVLIGGYALLRDPRSLAHPPLLAWIGGAIAFIGFLGVLTARLGAWWRHG